MRKKGDITLTNFLELVLAVAGLVLIVVLIYHFYQAATNTETQTAKDTLSSLEGKINLLKVGETGKYAIKGPCKKDKKGAEECGWILTGWSKNEAGRPDKCYFNSCVCVCLSGKNNDELKRSCQDNGFCKNLNIEEINLPVINQAKQQGADEMRSTGQLFDTSRGIKFPSNLIEINIAKEEINDGEIKVTISST